MVDPMQRLPFVAAAVVAALAVTPAAASANVSCEYGGSVLNVGLSGSKLVRASLTVAPDGAIVVADDSSSRAPARAPRPPCPTPQPSRWSIRPGMLGTGVDDRARRPIRPRGQRRGRERRERRRSSSSWTSRTIRNPAWSWGRTKPAAASASATSGSIPTRPKSRSGPTWTSRGRDSFVAGVGGPGLGQIRARRAAGGTGNPLTYRILCSAKPARTSSPAARGGTGCGARAGDDRLFGLGGDDSLDPGIGRRQPRRRSGPGHRGLPDAARPASPWTSRSRSPARGLDT